MCEATAMMGLMLAGTAVSAAGQVAQGRQAIVVAGAVCVPIFMGRFVLRASSASS